MRRSAPVLFSRVLFGLSISLALPATALAQERADDAAGGDFVTIGIGPGVIPDYEGSNDYGLYPVPGMVGSVGGYSFNFIGNAFSIDLIRDKPGVGWDVQAGPNVSLMFARRTQGSVSDARVKALPAVGVGVTVGGYVGLARQGVVTSDYDRLSVTVGVDHDVAGASGGTTITPSLNYMTPLSRRAMVLVAARAVRADDHYADAYFSVSPAGSVASGLPAFAAKGGWKNWSLAAATNVSLTGDLTHGLSAVGGVMYTRLLNDFAASPITSIAGSRNQWMAGLGLAYTF